MDKHLSPATFNNQMIGVTEFGFIRLWSAFTLVYDMPLVIDQEALETNLYKYKQDEKYNKLFSDIKVKKDEEKIDLTHGLAFSKALNKLELDKDDENIYYIIMDINEANEVLTSYKENILYTFHDLYDEVCLNQKTR